MGVGTTGNNSEAPLNISTSSKAYLSMKSPDVEGK